MIVEETDQSKCDHILGMEDNVCYSCSGFRFVYKRDIPSLSGRPLEEFLLFRFCPVCGYQFDLENPSGN